MQVTSVRKRPDL